MTDQPSTTAMKPVGRLRRLAPIASVLALAALGGALLGIGDLTGSLTGFSRDGSAPSDALVVSPESLDFGEAWAQDDFEWTVPIRNRSNTPILIQDLSTSCRCTSAEPRYLEIPPQATREVFLRLNLTPTSPEEAAVAVRDFGVFLYPPIPGVPPRQVRWHVHGRVRNQLTVSSRLVNFLLVRGTPPSSQAVVVKSAKPLRNLAARSGVGGAELHVQQTAAGDRECEYQVNITPPADLPLGAFDFVVELVPELADGSSLPAMPLKVIGQVVEDSQAIPAAIVAGRSDPFGNCCDLLTDGAADPRCGCESRLLGSRYRDAEEAFTRRPMAVRRDVLGTSNRTAVRRNRIPRNLRGFA